MGTVPSEGCAGQCLVLRVETGLVRLLECLLSITFMGIFTLVVLLVVMRYLFNSTVVGGNEATVMLFIYTTALGAAVDVARGKHIIVDTFVNYLPPVARYWLDIFNLVIVGVLNGFLMKYVSTGSLRLVQASIRCCTSQRGSCKLRCRSAAP